MSPIESRKPENACICGTRAPINIQTCPDCGDQMYLIGSAGDFTKQATKGVN
jgi:hypothetical protein